MYLPSYLQEPFASAMFDSRLPSFNLHGKTCFRLLISFISLFISLINLLNFRYKIIIPRNAIQ